MSQFVPSTIAKILAEVRSIASASDFGKFVAQRTAEQTRMDGGEYRRRSDPTRFFPDDRDASTIDALIEKVADLAPLLLPREKGDEAEHTWLACIRECANKNQAFTNRNHPRLIEIDRRFVDVLTSCFAVEAADPHRPAYFNESSNSMCFRFVAATLAELLLPDESGELRHFDSASDSLIDFLVRGRCPNRIVRYDYYGSFHPDTSEKLLVQAIYQSASPAKWIAQLALKGYLISTLHEKCFGYGCTFPRALGDPEGIRLLFRSLYIFRKKDCCTKLPDFLGEILKNIPSFPLSILNAPLNLPDEDGVLIEDTMLSITCQGTHYCGGSSVPLWQQLVQFGADVNGLVEDPADPTKKIVSRRDGKTPAMLAFAGGCDGVVKYFLEVEDLDLARKDNEGKSVVHYLLRRYDCRETFLGFLHNRNPALFVQHVTFADLDFALRNGLRGSVIFLLSQSDILFEVSQLQELFDFCWEQLLTSQTSGMKNTDPSWQHCTIQEEHDNENRRQGDQDHRDCHEFSFAQICIRHLSVRMHELGCAGSTVAFAARGANLEKEKVPTTFRWQEPKRVILDDDTF